MQDQDQDKSIQEDAEYSRQVQTGEVGGIVNEYIVEETDTLQDIANRYEVSIDEIIAANRDIITNPADMVKPGLKIMIPKKMK
jgi:nucleoid-associated protein YgaU